MEAEIRRARHTDIPTLTEIAHESKRHWGYPDHWMSLWRYALVITPAYVEQHLVYVGEVNGAAVGFYALVGAALR